MRVNCTLFLLSFFFISALFSQESRSVREERIEKIVKNFLGVDRAIVKIEPESIPGQESTEKKTIQIFLPESDAKKSEIESRLLNFLDLQPEENLDITYFKITLTQPKYR